MSGFDVDVYFSSDEASKNFQCGQYSVAILDVLMDGSGDRAIQNNVKY